MNLYSMLPFLEGWELLYFNKTEAVEKGKYKTVFSEQVKGWLQSLDIATDDAYASLKLTYLGYTGITTPHAVFIIGAVLPPPHGVYLTNYIRPSILSTAGIYLYSHTTSAYPMSIKGLVRLELGLEADSTQVTATTIVTFLAIKIVDEKAFIRSVRRFLYGWLGWALETLGHIPGLKYIGLPKDIKEVMD